ncbi:MAG: phosphatase PAP2 family protein [Clostridia bacterium]|nr:phosphatase PAP2 family protein [Clostridia bacterium]
MDFEVKIIEFLQAGRSPFFDAAFQVISQIGSVLGVLALCVLLLIFRRKLLGWYLFSYGFVYLFVNLLKEWVQRPRPYNAFDSISYIGDAVMDFSFPSGHVACATAIAIFLGYFLWQQYKGKGMRTLIVTFCSAFVLLVAISRMYLGKHYLTDVLAGFAISAVICTIGIALMRLYEKSRAKKKKEKANEN